MECSRQVAYINDTKLRAMMCNYGVTAPLLLLLSQPHKV